MTTRFSIFTLSAALVLSLSVSAKVVTVNNAEKAAKNFLASKGMPQEELVLLKTNVEPTVLRAPSIVPDSPAFHIFSDRDKKEIIVVSGDDVTRPILGYSFNYNADENGEIPPAMQDWLTEMERQITQARKAGIEQSAEAARQWRAPASGNVVKQLNTAKWGQNYPFNLDCPIFEGARCITGCVPTSYAILMKYYRYPSGATGSAPAYYSPKVGIAVSSRDLSATYDWDSMLMDYSGDYSYEQAMEVARLMADIGAALKADYSPQETGARYEGGYMFKHFGYNLGPRYLKSGYSAQEWNEMMKEQLDGNRPVLYNASIADNSASHSYIIDGYTDQDYFCINWGWAGSCDGVYALDAMIPYDLPYYTFTGSQAAYFDFQSALGLPTVAKVDDSIECPSVEAALAIAPGGTKPVKITIEGNCYIDEARVMSNQNIVLDLKGSKIEVLNYGLVNWGNLIIADSKGNGNMVFKRGNTEIITNYGNLTVYGGEYVNQVEIKEGDNQFYRRCIWSDRGSQTNIKGGKFKAIAGVVCTNGRLTIDGGEFECIGNETVINNYCTDDTVTINGGTFQNMTNHTDGSNYRRVIWSSAGTVTHITGGVFNCKNPVVFSNGNCIIDNGRFECIGNTSTVYNYSTTGKMTINGGIFVNSLGVKEPNDYRRAFYSVAESETTINGGKFTSSYQVLTIVGKAVINDATIENPNDGVGILAGGTGHVTVNYSKIQAKEIFHNNGSYLKCFGGLYSKTISGAYLGTGCQCVMNDDDATASVYHYKVVNPSGVENVINSNDVYEQHYDLNGIAVPDNKSGIHIIRTSDGRTMKVLYR